LSWMIRVARGKGNQRGMGLLQFVCIHRWVLYIARMIRVYPVIDHPLLKRYYFRDDNGCPGERYHQVWLRGGRNLSANPDAAQVE
jgi:hypothetical protein